MSSSAAVDCPDEKAIVLRGICKAFQIYDKPQDRLKQYLLPRLSRLARGQPGCYYREFWALRDINLHIGKGETVGIIGRNGSGKSTLLQIICGTLLPTGGEVTHSGRIAALLELGSGFNPEFTGRENVYMNASVLGLKKDEIDRRFDDIAAFADIGEFIEQPVKSYSSGMVVRLAFAVAINVDPEILIVDEALAVGDELFQRKCFSRIEAIRDSGATILFVSHSGSTVVELCDRAVLLDDGEKLAEGAPKAVVAKYQKLLYAPADRQDAVREQIRRSDLSAPDRPRQIPESGGRVDTVSQDDQVEECFDPGLRPASTEEYESHGATVSAPKILNLRGEQVNNLVRGRVYRYCYTVHFNRQVRNASFGMLIKTVSGVELGGGLSSRLSDARLPVAAAGAGYRIEFRFNCTLNPGMFFLNAGVAGDAGEGDTLLHRLTDCAMFRVVAAGDSASWGVVDFGCYPEIEQLDGLADG